jgi:cell division septum initiation protein DivIVA
MGHIMHRGYAETSVDAFAGQVVRELSVAEDQITDLRAEVDRLHTYIRRQWTAVAAAEAAGDRSAGRSTPVGDLVSPAAQARAVLHRAQEIADRRLAQADERLAEAETIAEQVLTEAHSDSTRLLLVARSRYEDIVIRAHQRADRAAELALDEFEHHDGRGTDDAGRVRAELEVKAAYLRTFAKVSRAALQAALDVTAREFDRLLKLEEAGGL